MAIALGAAMGAPAFTGAEATAAPVAFSRQQVKVGRQAWPVMQLRADLEDPKTRLALRFAYDTGVPLKRRQGFSGMAEGSQAAALVNGTFFSIRTADTMGTLVSEGRVRQHRDWDDRGTAFKIGADGRAQIRTLRVEGRPDHRNSRFYLTSGPRLVREGKVWLQPKREGFQDPALFGRHPRMALGLAEGGKTLIVACFPARMTLSQTAQAMRTLGAHDALNLDGGPSVGMAYRGKIVASPHWGLTNALVLYDAKYPGPARRDDGLRQAAAVQAPVASVAAREHEASAPLISSAGPSRSRAPEACHGRLGRTARSRS
ncbi:phosphodiester glycosidase family protein [bacterium]|nr:phosphodiester glycosidase family protein [bacterium]